MTPQMTCPGPAQPQRQEAGEGIPKVGGVEGRGPDANANRVSLPSDENALKRSVVMVSQTYEYPDNP